MKVLVTGGAGFIGSHLCEGLLARGDRVVALDDLSTGARANVLHLMEHPRFELVEGSVRDRSLVGRIARGAGEIFHLAAAVGVRLIVENPVQTIETNIGGTEVVLEAAAEHGAHVLLASTSEVYGKSDQVPFSEHQDLLIGPPTKARWSYACSKAIDEFLAFAHARQSGLGVTVVRLFNTVGPRQTGRYGMVIPSFVEQALAGRAVRVFGDGAQTRCFCHVKDTVRALLELAGCAAARAEVINVGNDVELSITALAELVIARSGSSSSLCYVPYVEAYGEGFEDMRRRVPDLSKLESLLGWRPRTPLSQIVDDVLAERRGEGLRGDVHS